MRRFCNPKGIESFSPAGVGRQLSDRLAVVVQIAPGDDPSRSCAIAAARQSRGQLAQTVAADSSRSRGALSNLDYYLDEFVFRFNRRHSRSRGLLFYRLIEQTLAIASVRCSQLVGGTKPQGIVQENRVNSPITLKPLAGKIFRLFNRAFDLILTALDLCRASISKLTVAR